MSDYISREAITEWRPKNKEIINSRAYIDLEELLDLVDGIPAADVEPVRHGNWNIRLADELTLCLECSACGRSVDNIDLHHLLEAGEYGEACKRYPYCHCGSKMDLEVENDG
jgi:hypothetical protein|nr:MAG TPA_asm: DNA REPAIR HELICASE RAD25, SSL2, PRE-INITIATION COMPLEX, RNA POLYMERASE.0A [Caudoviricetes sp.]